MCTITATEFKTQFGKYLELSNKEDILITKNGKPFATITAVKSNNWNDFFDEWAGTIDEKDVDLDDPRIAHMLGK